MATARSRRGKSAAFQEGDLAATDPIGIPFTGLYFVEIKRGYGRWGLIDEVDARPGAASQTFSRFWKQALTAAVASSPARIPLLIAKRDQRQPVVVIPFSHARELVGNRPPEPLLILYFSGGSVAMLSLEGFFKIVNPERVRALFAEGGPL
jgi:hypothetical protein